MIQQKNILIMSLMAVLTLVSFVGCASSGSNLSAYMQDGNELRVYEIFGMDCPGCHGGLENLVGMVPGVVASKANWEKQQLQVVVAANTEVTDQQIFDAVKEANFTAGKRLK